MLYYKLQEGGSIALEKKDLIIENTVLTNAKDKALKFLSYKARTHKEVEEKLKDETYTDDVIEKVMDMLVKYNYINDHEYTKAYVRSKKNYGELKIKFELKNRGIKESLITEVLADYNQRERIVALFQKKLKGDTELCHKEKKRAFDYVARRGFCYDDITSGFEDYKKLCCEEEDLF